MSVVIRTERLELRALDASGARSVLRGAPPEDLSWAYGYPLPFTLEAAAMVLQDEPVARGRGPFVSFQVLRRADSLVVGDCGFGARPDAAGLVEIRHELVPQSRRGGLESEAIEALIGFAFTRDEVVAVRAWAPAGNAAAQRTLERAGMNNVGEREGRICFEA